MIIKEEQNGNRKNGAERMEKKNGVEKLEQNNEAGEWSTMRSRIE